MDPGFPVSDLPLPRPPNRPLKKGVDHWRLSRGFLTVEEAAERLDVDPEDIADYVRSGRLRARWFDAPSGRFPVLPEKRVDGLAPSLDKLDELDEISSRRYPCYVCWETVDRAETGELIEHFDPNARGASVRPRICAGSGLVPEDIRPAFDFTPPEGVPVVRLGTWNLARRAEKRGYVSLRYVSRRILKWNPERTRDLAERGELPSVWLELPDGVRLPALRKTEAMAFRTRRRFERRG